MDLILGAVIGAVATLLFSLVRDVVQRRWARADEVAKSTKVKAERADQRSEEAAGRIVDLADQLQQTFFDFPPGQDQDEEDRKGTGSSTLTREILAQAARITSKVARSRIEIASYVAGSAETIQWRTGHQLGHIGWRVGREIREVAGAVLRNESMPANSIEEYVMVWESFNDES